MLDSEAPQRLGMRKTPGQGHPAHGAFLSPDYDMPRVQTAARRRMLSVLSGDMLPDRIRVCFPNLGSRSFSVMGPMNTQSPHAHIN